MKEPREPFDGTDTLIVVGLMLLAAGLAAYDWRIAAVVTGVILMMIGLVVAVRG